MSAAYRVLLYYKFVPIDDPKAFAAEHLEWCRELGLLGRILVASEGLNGTVSGPVEATDAYKQGLWADPRFADMPFKEDESEGHAFAKLFVRERPEIISLGPNEPADVLAKTGVALDAERFQEMLGDPDAIILDGRNEYESAMGRFEGAICPPVMNFREFPQWIRENLSDKKDKKIVTYCTGGIRCEKLTSWMIQEGFQDVYQLEGGIVTYGKDPATGGDGFEGSCYVFDERVKVPVNRTESAKIVTKCLHCGIATENTVNCANVVCNLQFTCCPSCVITRERTCSKECRHSPYRREHGEKLNKLPAGRRAYSIGE